MGEGLNLYYFPSVIFYICTSIKLTACRKTQMHIIFNQPVPWFSTLLRFRTLWAYGFDSGAPLRGLKSGVWSPHLTLDSYA